MNRIFASLALAPLLLRLPAAAADFRPPAVPLVTHDPYFSIWSMADHLNDTPTKHWTGAVHSLTSLIRIDGKTYRLMGSDPRGATPLEQTKLEVLPTHTIYQFAGAGVRVNLTFLTPSLPDDLDVLSRPATYLTWDVESTDGAGHQAALYFDAGSEISVNTRDEPVTWSRFRLGDNEVLRTGSQQQPVLEKSGDDLRGDWGYLYAIAPVQGGTSRAATTRREAIKAFTTTGQVPDNDDLKSFQPYAQPTPVLAYSFDLGTVAASPVSRQVVLAYDDEFSIDYFQRHLRPYWRRNGDGAAELLTAALRDYSTLEERSARFDKTLMADLREVGGDKYAQLCALAYRQTLAAHKLVADVDGTPLFFSKENFSNGSIDTVDVTYRARRFFCCLMCACWKDN